MKLNSWSKKLYRLKLVVNPLMSLCAELPAQSFNINRDTSKSGGAEINLPYKEDIELNMISFPWVSAVITTKKGTGCKQRFGDI